MQKNHALLITFYWPPSSGPGVYRWLRFSKYFSENNWDLTVYIPKNANYKLIDQELIKQVPKEISIIEGKYFDPTSILPKKANSSIAGGFTNEKKQSFIKKLIIRIRGNFFVPDARVFWIKPSTKKLIKHIKNHPEITTIISSGPPHSTHIIALNLKKQFPQLKWVADFRDPWTGIDFYKELYIGKRADEKHKRLEKEVLTKADHVISISQSCCDELAEIGQRPVDLVTNGFEFEDFDTTKIELNKEFTLSHFGSLSTSRNPKNLWKALSELVVENSEFSKSFKLNLYGAVDISIFNLIEKYGLKQHTEHFNYVSHAKSIDLQRSTQLLLLIANNSGNVKGTLTGKVFEYLGAKRPILAIGMKNSDLMEVIQHTESGFFCDFNELEVIKTAVLKAFSSYQQKELNIEAKNIDAYSSKNIIKTFLKQISN